MRFLSAIPRWVFGAFYGFIGAEWLLDTYLGKPSFTPAADESAAAKALASALTESGFINPLIATTCLIGGILLFTKRTTPFGLLVLAPLVTVIFLFHVCLQDVAFYKYWGTAQILYWSFLTFQNRQSFERLWCVA